MWPLWQIIRASTAAPTFFPPDIVQVGATRFEFEDGGITPYNNPAFLLFLMATSAPYRVGWATGADKLLLVSVGTGSVPNNRAAVAPKGMMCRMFAKTLAGPPIDSEVGDLVDGSGLASLGLPRVKPHDIQRLDGVRSMAELVAVCQAVARSQIRAEHFADCVP